MSFPDWMPKFQFSFVVQTAINSASLTFIPTGYAAESRNHENAQPFEIYGIYTDVVLTRDSPKLTVPTIGFIHPIDFRKLDALLSNPTHTQARAEIHCPEGGLLLKFKWQQDGRLNIAGQFPNNANFTPEYHQERYGEFPLKIDFRFECSVKPELLETTKTDLENLIIAIEVIESGQQVES